MQRAHGLSGGVDIAEDNVRLTAHLHCLERDNVQNNAVGREQHVEIALEVLLGQLIIKVVDV